ncbi:MAG: hypothetical protein QOD63_2201 [Actinomycetota bacterium]|nr:hypothetical protein [Actinomycetota bacterium]
MFNSPKRVFVPLGIATAVLLALSAALGSDGPTDGDPDLGQHVANFTYPLFILALIALVALGAAFAISRLRASAR